MASLKFIDSENGRTYILWKVKKWCLLKDAHAFPPHENYFYIVSYPTLWIYIEQQKTVNNNLPSNLRFIFKPKIKIIYTQFPIILTNLKTYYNLSQINAKLRWIIYNLFFFYFCYNVFLWIFSSMLVWLRYLILLIKKLIKF